MGNSLAFTRREVVLFGDGVERYLWRQHAFQQNRGSTFVGSWHVERVASTNVAPAARHELGHGAASDSGTQQFHGNLFIDQGRELLTLTRFFRESQDVDRF